jgi:hypothetical protein
MITTWPMPIFSRQSGPELMDLHLTVNGMGERAGNASMASAVAAINDFMPEVRSISMKKRFTQ